MEDNLQNYLQACWRKEAVGKICVSLQQREGPCSFDPSLCLLSIKGDGRN
jgi:hypothetical protein